MGLFSKRTYEENGTTIIHVDYRSTTSKVGGNDKVCQTKMAGKEIGHCTWHPDGKFHEHGNCSGKYNNCRKKKNR